MSLSSAYMIALTSLLLDISSIMLYFKDWDPISSARTFLYSAVLDPIEIKILEKQNIIFNALHGGIGENRKIQAWLDENNIKYTGSGAFSSSLCMDKAASKEIAKRNGIETPDWQLIKKIDQRVKMTLPFVVKPNELFLSNEYFVVLDI